MGKKNMEQASFSKVLTSGERYLIEDREHGSSAFVPILLDKGIEAEVIQLDQGLLNDLQPGERVCDSLLFSKSDCVHGLKITWFIELKGTKNEKEAKEALEQISKTINHLNQSVQQQEANQYVKNRDYVFAAVAGAPDKTLPVMNNDDLKGLCRKLYSMSTKKKAVKDMFMLFCYIRPNRNYSRVKRSGLKPPYDIQCYSSKEGYIPYPSMLLELLK